jgi:hypothetical protein
MIVWFLSCACEYARNPRTSASLHSPPPHTQTQQTARQRNPKALPHTLSWLLALAPSMRSVKTMWLRLDCSFIAVQPTVRFSIARARRASTCAGGWEAVRRISQLVCGAGTCWCGRWAVNLLRAVHRSPPSNRRPDPCAWLAPPAHRLGAVDVDQREVRHVGGAAGVVDDLFFGGGWRNGVSGVMSVSLCFSGVRNRRGG